MKLDARRVTATRVCSVFFFFGCYIIIISSLLPPKCFLFSGKKYYLFYSIMSLGVTRSRTLLFFSYRDSAPRKSPSRRFNNHHHVSTSLADDEDDERRGLIQTDGGNSISLDMTEPPKWYASFAIPFFCVIPRLG